MKLFRQKSLLGLNLGERLIAVVEAPISGQAAKPVTVAEFIFPNGVSWDNPRQLGTMFSVYLEENGFTAKSAVAGLPARWLLSREKRFPATDGGLLAGMVALAAEQSFAIDSEQMVFDYFENNAPAQDHGEGQSRRVFLAGITRERYQAVWLFAESAGLRLLSVAPALLPMIAMSQPLPPPACGVYLRIRHDYVEMAICELGRLRWLRALEIPCPANLDDAAEQGFSRQWLGELANRMRMAFAALAFDSPATKVQLQLCYEAGSMAGHEERQLLELLRQRLGISVETMKNGEAAEAVMAGLKGALVGGDKPGFASSFGAASALALAGMRGARKRDTQGQAGLELDFLHSRLAAPRDHRWSSRCNRVAVLAAGVVLVAGWSLAGGYFQQREVAVLRDRLASGQFEQEAAEEFWQCYSMLLDWTEQRPRFLEPLRELSLSLPQDHPIWVGSLTIRENNSMTVIGRARREQTILDTLDRLRENPRFEDVKLLYIREGGSDKIFSMSLTFKGE